MDIELADKEFQECAAKVAKFISDYDTSHKTRPVIGNVKPGDVFKSFPGEVNDQGEKDFEIILSDVWSKIVPGMCHWSHPDNIAWFPNLLPRVLILGSMLETALNCIGFSWSSSPALTELEQVVMDWIADLYGLPDCFKFSSNGGGGGCFQGTASEAVLNACLAARNRSLSFNDVDPRRFVAYCSTQSHSSTSRAAQMCLMKIRSIEPDLDGILTGQLIKEQMIKDIDAGLIPSFVIATLGTTGLCAFDDIKSITEVCRELETKTRPIWIHVDSAYAGSMLVLPDKRGKLLDGVDQVNTFNTNLSKVGTGGFDSSPMWIRNRTDLTNSFEESPDYLKHHESEFDEQFHQINLRNWTVPFGRKFRAVRVWLCMKWFGREGMQESARQHIKLAQIFEKCIRDSEEFNVIYPVHYGLVCFRLPTASNDDHDQIATKLKNEQQCLVTTAVWKDQTYFRASFNQFTCTEANVVEIYEKISDFCKKRL